MMSSRPTVSRPIPLRLDSKTVKRIAVAQRSLGISRSALMRLAIVNQLSEIEHGIITLHDIERHAKGET